MTCSPVYVSSQVKSCTVVRRLRVQGLNSQGTCVALKILRRSSFSDEDKKPKTSCPASSLLWSAGNVKGSLHAEIRTTSYDFAIRVSGATL